MFTNWEYHYDNCVQRYLSKQGRSTSQKVVRPHLIIYIWVILTAASHGSDKRSGQPVGVVGPNWTLLYNNVTVS